jgi:ABC-2 type transport system permease protein
MKQLWSVIRFEFATFAKNKAFVGMTIFLMVLALIGPAVPVVVRMFGNVTGERTIAVVDNTNWFNADILAEYISPRASFFTNIDEARSAVENGIHNYAIEINDGSFTLHVTAVGLGVSNLQSQAANMLRHRHRVESFGELGVAQTQVNEIFMFHPAFDVLTIGDVVPDADVLCDNFMYAYVMTFVLYFGLLVGGAHLLTTVVREKSTKTMELLITSCPPRTMLNGKVIGVGAAIMTQILLMVGAALVSLQLTPLFTEGMEDIFTVTLRPQLLVFLVIFFLLGFIMYSFIYAALASTTSRMEDATSMGQLPQMLIMVAFFASIFASQNPGAQWVPVLSHIPLFSPFIMFVRYCMGTAANWEIYLSIAVQVVTIGVISWMAAKIYRMGTLMYGAKPSFKKLLDAFK